MKYVKTLLFLLLSSRSGFSFSNQNEDKPRVYHAFAGPSVLFYDFEKGKRIVRKGDWALTAPKWRLMGRGLTVEGICQNVNCEAHGKRVLVTIGLGSYLLVEFGKYTADHKCPVCGHTIDPKTVGFTGVHYKLKGRKTVGTKVETRWETQDKNGFVFLDEELQGTAEFDKIRIETLDCQSIKPEEEDV